MVKLLSVSAASEKYLCPTLDAPKIAINQASGSTLEGIEVEKSLLQTTLAAKRRKKRKHGLVSWQFTMSFSRSRRCSQKC